MDLGPASAEQVQRFISKAHDELRAATFEELLSFLTIRRLAPGSAHARFMEAFPSSEDAPGGREAFLAELKCRATERSDVSPLVEVDLMKLTNDLRDRVDGVGERLRQIALHEFDAYATDTVQRSNEIIRMLMTSTARSDEPTRQLLAARYRMTDEGYAARYDALLTALGRQPIAEVEGCDGLALIIACVLDGFLARAAIERDDPRARDLFEATVVPLIGALTYPKESLNPSDENHLYFSLVSSATADYLRTPPDTLTLPGPDLIDLRGTWQGTLRTNVVLKEQRPLRGAHEAYLVIDDSEPQLKVTTYMAGGLSRMLSPQFLLVGDRSRLACMYEAELAHNPSPERPSHRGAWILEADRPATELIATYFTDRSTRGQFVFDRHEAGIAANYVDAQTFWGDWEPKEVPAGYLSGLSHNSD